MVSLTFLKALSTYGATRVRTLLLAPYYMCDEDYYRRTLVLHEERAWKHARLAHHGKLAQHTLLTLL